MDTQTPLQFVSSYISLLGWPALLLIAWNLRGMVDRFLTKLKTASERAEETHRIVVRTAAGINMIQENHLAHFESDLKDIKTMHNEAIGLLRDIKEGISVLVDRGRP